LSGVPAEPGADLAKSTRAGDPGGSGRAAAELAEQLKAESDRLLHVNPRQSLVVAEDIAELAKRAGLPSLDGLGQLAVGDALRELGRYREALSAYARAAEVYATLNDDVGWARSRIGATLTWRYTGVTAENLAEIDRARGILSEHGLWLRLARLEQHVGLLLCELGRFDAATQAYERALESSRRIDPRDPSQEARILGNFAMVSQRRGEFERAQTQLSMALSVFEAYGHEQHLAVGKAISAQLLADQGHYSRALETALSARRTFHEYGTLIDAAFVGRVAVHSLLELNRVEEAIQVASDVMDEFSTAGADINVAGTLLLRSRGLRRMGRHAEALADLDRAEPAFAASDCLGWVATLRGERAAILEASGAWQLAAAQAERAAADLSALGQVVTAAQASLVRASALRSLGQSDAARKTVRKVLAGTRARGVPWLDYQAWRLEAEMARSAGHSARAVAAFDAAIQALEQLQGRVLTHARAEFLSDKLSVYSAAVDLRLQRGEHRRAFGYAERAKSRALVDALAGQLDIRIRPRTPAQQRLAVELMRLRRHHDQLSSVGSGAVTSVGDDGSRPREFPQTELAASERQIAALLEELQQANVADLERLALLQGRIYPLELDEHTRLIEYFGVEDDLCVFVGRPPRVKGFRLAGARPRVERLSGQLQLAMQTTAATYRDSIRLHALEPAARHLLGKLYGELVRPFATSIEAAERLVIVPHGVLHRLPFAALHDGTRYLAEKHEVVTGPSASALAFCRRPVNRPSVRALVVAHSDAGALPGAVREGERVASLLQARRLFESEATREQLIEQARAADVIHLATHGFARMDAPLFSYLRLYDGQLTALDCFDLELDCSLVTLSACETGWAHVVPGDEQVGLSRALLYAGARSVVQTLWRVEDETTAALMERFYAGLQAGHGRARALRDAQLEVLRTPGRSHPFFWAPFVLVGEWGAVRRLCVQSPFALQVQVQV
jgi:CHAT domain-containing protein